MLKEKDPGGEATDTKQEHSLSGSMCSVKKSKTGQGEECQRGKGKGLFYMGLLGKISSLTDDILAES